MASGKTSKYYKSNPAAAKRRVKQQAKYNKTKKGKNLISGATKLRDKLKCKKGEDASHTSKTKGKCENAKKNRTRPRKGKQYAKK